MTVTVTTGLGKQEVEQSTGGVKALKQIIVHFKMFKY